MDKILITEEEYGQGQQQFSQGSQLVINCEGYKIQQSNQIKRYGLKIVQQFLHGNDILRLLIVGEIHIRHIVQIIVVDGFLHDGFGGLDPCKVLLSSSSVRMETF